jgi:anhydro-N-acetylmuramic acid kinase
MQLFIGLLSGTSADAIDAVLIDFESDKPKILQTHLFPIPKTIKTTVVDLAISGHDEIEKVRELDLVFGKMFSEAALAVCKKAGINPTQVTAIGSHGQTVRHYPPTTDEKNTALQGYSLQIGDPNIIVEQTGITTVADFRRRDIAAGGHGAPLAPALHNAVFRDKNKSRIVLNTGGIANITYLPTTGKAIGFDTGPANGLMDSWCQLHLGQDYDKDGEWASNGTCNDDLLKKLLKHPYFALPVPKSTGREDFNLPWLQQQLADFNETLNPRDVQATLLAFTVESIADCIEAIDPKHSDVFICGGGAHNTALYQRLTERLAPRYFSSTDSLGIPADWVEAVAFAWLAKQNLDKSTGNLPSVTGANKDVVLGGVYWAS